VDKELKKILLKEFAFIVGATTKEVHPDSLTQQCVDDVSEQLITLISKTVNKVIGKDEFECLSNIMTEDGGLAYEYKLKYRNIIRAEQRNRLAELLNKKEEK